MTECKNCGRKSQVFLCQSCRDELRSMLIGMAYGQELPNGHRAAGFLEFLEDAALGRTRLGESARRSTEMNSPVPFNSRASELLAAVHNTLTGWCQHLIESRGVQYVELNSGKTTEGRNVLVRAEE